mmetsp:Transcript_13214/g.28128  ORF Transcript_13214/g.28128 Transcript_13214/m.28128 type:complete len:280 (+) Transcript_13214:63-902(+)|eukprot:6208122-Pleurochrysis_carterae.AAC.4
MADEDYYAILGVSPDASVGDIQKAYRKCSLAVHPDRYKGNDPDFAVREFLQLTKAKEVLSDAKARAAFDAVVRARTMHKAKLEAQHAGRRRMREDLEAREELAKRQKPTAMETAAEMRVQKAAEEAARADLQKEIERLKRQGMLGRPPRERKTSASSIAPGPGTRQEGAATAQSGNCGLPENQVRPAEAPADEAQDGNIPAAQSATEEPLPPGWKMVASQGSRPYYYHVGTRQRQWSRPAFGTGSDVPNAPLLPSKAHESLEALTLRRIQEKISAQQHA